MNRIRLVHLTLVGPSVEPATVEFAPGLTVIHGASETGKSYIVGAIDFMLGGRTPPKPIIEARGYTHALLGLSIGGEDTLTLARSVEGGPFGLYASDVRELPQPEPPTILSQQHSEKNIENLSNFILKDLGLSGYRVKKNQKNQTASLSLRNLSQYCVVDETSMQSELSPILTGQYVTRTSERATFKLLLEGQDDSSLTESVTGDQAVSRGKLEVVDRLIAETETSVRNPSDKTGLGERLARINETLHGFSVEATTLASTRDQVIASRAVAQESLRELDDRRAELRNLTARFGLLRDKYQSDLDRLEMVEEVGTLLGYFTPGICVFCGAEVEHQNQALHTHGEATEIAASVGGERTRTRALLADLLTTIDGIAEEGVDLDRERIAAQSALSGFEQSLSDLDQQLAPVNAELAELLDARSSVERDLGLLDQLERLMDLRRQYVADDGGTRGTASIGPAGIPDDMALREFTQIVSRVLSDWQLAETEPVHFDRQIDDIIVAGRARPDRGKGMRSILHAAFKVALLSYCFARDLPHPGFLILDSPLVTYREPYGPPQDDEIELDAVSGYVADALFRNLAGDFPGQTVILENVDPPSDVTEKDAKTIRFTKSTESRYGFFPVRAELAPVADD